MVNKRKPQAELLDLEIMEVSLVEKPAIERTFLTFKSADGEQVKLAITKEDRNLRVHQWIMKQCDNDVAKLGDNRELCKLWHACDASTTVGQYLNRISGKDEVAKSDTEYLAMWAALDPESIVKDWLKADGRL